MASTGTAASSAEKKNAKNTAVTDAKETSAAKQNDSVYKAFKLKS